jgi:hypothetical protein
MGLRYLGSSSLSRWACRASMRELRIASTFSSSKLGGGDAAAAFAEALELFIFVGADEVAGDLAVTRDGDRLPLRARGSCGKFRQS